MNNLGSRLLPSQREALDRAGAPTEGDDGAPVSDGWRAQWAAEEVVRLRQQVADQRHQLDEATKEVEHLRAECRRLLKDRDELLWWMPD